MKIDIEENVYVCSSSPEYNLSIEEIKEIENIFYNSTEVKLASEAEDGVIYFYANRNDISKQKRTGKSFCRDASLFLNGLLCGYAKDSLGPMEGWG